MFFDAHLDQYGPQSGGWGSPEQLRQVDKLAGALRVFFCEVDGAYPTTVKAHLDAAADIMHRLLPQNTPAGWRLGRDFRYHVEGIESPRTVMQVEEIIGAFHGWGVRGGTPIYHPGNPLGGCSKESGTGLTELGQRMLAYMWQLGWWVDTAHMSEQSTDDAISLWRTQDVEKLCYTHGGIRHEGITDPILAKGNLERCISLDQAMRIVRCGGLVCISPCRPFYPGFDGVFMEHIRALGRASDWRGVGIGTDYGGILDEWRFPNCATIADCFAQLAATLYDEGFTSPQIEAITGGNARRFFLGQ